MEGTISLVSLNKELFISASKRINVSDTKTVEIRFIDSLQFMSSGLYSLAKNLESYNFESVPLLDSFEKLLDILLPPLGSSFKSHYLKKNVQFKTTGMHKRLGVNLVTI